MIKLETERLALRPWTEDDFDSLAIFYSDRLNAKYVGGLKNSDEAWRALATHIGHWQLKGFGYWAVDERISGEFVGCVGLWQSATMHARNFNQSRWLVILIHLMRRRSNWPKKWAQRLSKLLNCLSMARIVYIDIFKSH